MLYAIITSGIVHTVLLYLIYKELTHIKALLLEEADEREFDRQARYLNDA
jgi:hypothetical protein